MFVCLFLVSYSSQNVSPGDLGTTVRGDRGIANGGTKTHMGVPGNCSELIFWEGISFLSPYTTEKETKAPEDKGPDISPLKMDFLR